MRRILLALCAFAVVAPAQQPKRQALPQGVRVERDVLYAKTPQKDLLLDVYLPEGGVKDPRPLVVWIHGGGWRRGSKQRNPAAFLVPYGYVSASISYRLSGEAIFPAQIHDCKAAIRWLRANAERYGIDPEAIGVWGASAGGHLVALLGTSGGAAELEGEAGGNLERSSRVQAVVDYYGPTDFPQMDKHSISDRIIHDAPDSPESLLIGGPIQQYPERTAKANPITYVSADDPPFLLVHGDRDPLVPHHQSVLLLSALERVGVEARLHTIPGGGHGGAEFHSGETRAMVREFFDRHLKAGE